MGLTGSIVLVAFGAVLAFAVDWQIQGVDLQIVGWILMAVGLVGMIAVMSLYGRRRYATHVAPPTEVIEERRYH
ncbi:DUF6458 family protein [Streptomyces sp. NPDC126514]|uniref:DUF6458 family protein n=1 Tax=Streptomyces sp. NPDC126514 TaxID=3155210 RepID=UPI00331D0A72